MCESASPTPKLTDFILDLRICIRCVPSAYFITRSAEVVALLTAPVVFLNSSIRPALGEQKNM